MTIYPANNPSKFSVKLAQTLEMNEQYEVWLAEIKFPTVISMYVKMKSGSITIIHHMKDTTPQTCIHVTHLFWLNYRQVYTTQLRTVLTI